ncbi:hemerythrin domain-containing protein [Rubrivivax sp. RP6-9]|uniref:hemerythrin domain-containing protein n=1 Tax=Rubrivivax sp. RP6-9 TaxID=3415750 RepID=UPI003CC64A20
MRTDTFSHNDSSVDESLEVDALALLGADHGNVRELFVEYHELARGDGMDAVRLDLVAQICNALSVHAAIEEEIFYPAARDALGDPGWIEKAEREHAEARTLIEQLQAMDPSEGDYDSTVQQLQDAVDMHVQEEEDLLFPQARESHLDMMSLGLQMAERRDELLSRLEEGGAKD